jgi:hypothetical protein
MIEQFWFYFLGTGIVTRILTPPLHFRNKTPTHFVRKKTQKEFHHFHLGLIFAIVAIVFVFLKGGINNPLLFFAAMGMSFVADELFIVKNFSEYFTKKGLFLSVMGHLVVGIMITILLVLAF